MFSSGKCLKWSAVRQPVPRNRENIHPTIFDITFGSDMSNHSNHDNNHDNTTTEETLAIVIPSVLLAVFLFILIWYRCKRNAIRPCGNHDQERTGLVDSNKKTKGIAN